MRRDCDDVAAVKDGAGGTRVFLQGGKDRRGVA